MGKHPSKLLTAPQLIELRKGVIILHRLGVNAGSSARGHTKFRTIANHIGHSFIRNANQGALNCVAGLRFDSQAIRFAVYLGKGAFSLVRSILWIQAMFNFFQAMQAENNAYEWRA